MSKTTQQLQAQLDAVRFANWVQGDPDEPNQACLVLRRPNMELQPTSHLHEQVFEDMEGKHHCRFCSCYIGSCLCAEEDGVGCDACRTEFPVVLTLNRRARQLIRKVLRKLHPEQFDAALCASKEEWKSYDDNEAPYEGFGPADWALVYWNDDYAESSAQVAEVLDEALRMAKEDTDARRAK